MFATWCAVQFAARPIKPRNGRLRFSLVKPVRNSDAESLAQVGRFIDACGEDEHDIYLCSADSAPVEWMKERPGVTWLRLKAEQKRNGKAATLALGEKYWSGDIFVISDADMGCSSEYLDAVLGEVVPE